LRNLGFAAAFSKWGRAADSREAFMPAYRLRDVAVLVGAVVVGAAAGFNGGWLAAVPPKVITVDTPNKLATGNADIRTPVTAHS
jgi:hypothetical protein